MGPLSLVDGFGRHIQALRSLPLIVETWHLPAYLVDQNAKNARDPTPPALLLGKGVCDNPLSLCAQSSGLEIGQGPLRPGKRENATEASTCLCSTSPHLGFKGICWQEKKLISSEDRRSSEMLYSLALKTPLLFMPPTVAKRPGRLTGATEGDPQGAAQNRAPGCLGLCPHPCLSSEARGLSLWLL